MEIGLNTEKDGTTPNDNQAVCSHEGHMYAVLNDGEGSDSDPSILQQILYGKFTTRITVTDEKLGSIFAFSEMKEAVLPEGEDEQPPTQT